MAALLQLGVPADLTAESSLKRIGGPIALQMLSPRPQLAALQSAWRLRGSSKRLSNWSHMRVLSWGQSPSPLTTMLSIAPERTEGSGLSRCVTPVLFGSVGGLLPSTHVPPIPQAVVAVQAPLGIGAAQHPQHKQRAMAARKRAMAQAAMEAVRLRAVGDHHAANLRPSAQPSASERLAALRERLRCRWAAS